MKANHPVFLSIFFLFGIVCAAAQSTIDQSKSPLVSSEPISFATQLSMYSKILGETHTMNVYLPKSFHVASKEHTYPIIFLHGIHGEKFFLTISGIVEHLSYVTRMPEAIVVSFPKSGYYAPDVYTNGMWSRREKIESEDPDLLIQYLKEELFPYFKKHYRATDYRMIVGVSGSSIFPLHTFAKAPDLFQAHITIATADMLGMGYEPNHTFVDAFAESLAKKTDRTAQLYVGVASSDMTWDERYQSNLDNLQKQLSPFQSRNLKLKVEIIPNEGHYDSIIKAMLSAFEMIFPKQDWDPKFRDLIKQPGNALENIDAAHHKLSKKYGFAILPKAERWNNVNCLRFIGGKLLRDGRIQEAVEVFERRVKYRPKSPWAHHSLAEALATNKQLKEAIKIQQKALELAKKHDADNLSEYQEQLLEFENQLGK